MQTAKIKSKSEKELLIREFLSSGRPKTIWCQEKGIPYPTFYKWMKHYERENETTQTKFIALPKTPDDKVLKPKDPAPITQQVTPCVMIEVNDCKITISDFTDLNLLTNVIKAVKLADV